MPKHGLHTSLSYFCSCFSFFLPLCVCMQTHGVFSQRVFSVLQSPENTELLDVSHRKLGQV